MERGPVGARFAGKLRELRRARGWDQARLSARLTAIGHPIGVNAISRLEKGERRADVSDLVALAVALDCTPSRLYLPDEDPGEPVAVTAGTTRTWRRAWQWAAGERSLDDPEQETFPRTMKSWDNYLEAARWVAANCPHDESHQVTAGQMLDAAGDDLQEVEKAIQEAQERGVPRPVIFAYLDFMKVMSPAGRGETGDDGR